MSKLLRADFYRMYHNKKFWICVSSMIIVALMFIVMQYTAMDYVVALDRVIFLPMSFYGLAIGALLAFFIGDDFSDGVIRNKLVAGRGRSSVYLSNLICGWSACIAVYLLTAAVTVGVGMNFFENNVSMTQFAAYLILGIFTCLAFGSIFGMLSMLIGDRTLSVLICISLAFIMLFLCLHTNQIIVQQPTKDGTWNPYYVGGIKRAVYELLHDLNPCGQAAQLSSMEYLNPVRWICLDIFWIVLAIGLGNRVFGKKDIR